MRWGCPWNLVAAEDDNARFSPAWIHGGGITGAAYAIYQFSLPGYTGEESLSLTWSESADFADAWLALANFTRDRWDWFHMPAASGGVSRLDQAFADYIDPGDGRMLVVPLFINAAGASWLLAEVRVGAAAAQPWLHTWGGPQTDCAYGAATDAAGDLYLTGYTDSYSVGQEDLLLLKYAADGTLLWARSWGAETSEYGMAVAVDSAGEVYIVGGTDGFDAKYGLVILRLSSDGVPEWQKLYSMEQMPLSPNSIAVDNEGNVFALGTVTTVEIIDDTYIEQYDAVALKLDPQGALLWDFVWAGLHSDYLNAVVADSAGGCYASGWLSAFESPNAKLGVLKFKSEGGLDWAKSWACGVAAEALGMTRAPDGTLWLAGLVQQNDILAQDALLLSLGPAGNVLSAAKLGGSYDDMLHSVAVAANGTVYACGETYSAHPSSSACDALYAVVDSGGLRVAKAWGGTGTNESFYGGGLAAGSGALLGGVGKTPASGSWIDLAATYQSGLTGTPSIEGTALKNLHGALSDIAGTPAGPGRRRRR